MILRPCQHCIHKDGCAIRADLQKRARDSGLAGKLGVVRFRCPPRWVGIETGRRVSVTLKSCEPGEHDTGHPEGWFDDDPIFGTISGRTPEGKLIVWLDAPTTLGRVRIRLHPDYSGLIPLEEMGEICEACHKPAAGHVKEAWLCDLCGDVDLAQKIRDDDTARLAAMGGA